VQIRFLRRPRLKWKDTTTNYREMSRGDLDSIESVYDWMKCHVYCIICFKALDSGTRIHI
jgi:hypothetical protein